MYYVSHSVLSHSYLPLYINSLNSAHLSFLMILETMLSFRHPTTILIAGPTQAGKSFFFKQILDHDLIQPAPNRIIYVYAEHHPDLASHYPNVEFIQGVKNLLPILPTVNPDERNVVVLDDQMSEAGRLEEVSNLFTKGSHHRNITAVYIVQNVFDKGKVHRTISLNSHYIILFKNPRDQGQVRTLAQQVFPNQVKYFMNAFQDATSRDHGYLVLDLHPLTPEDVRVRSHIFKNEEMTIYSPLETAGDKEFDLTTEGYIKPLGK